jgi:hypothetical protein
MVCVTVVNLAYLELLAPQRSDSEPHVQHVISSIFSSVVIGGVLVEIHARMKVHNSLNIICHWLTISISL